VSFYCVSYLFEVAAYSFFTRSFSASSYNFFMAFSAKSGPLGGPFYPYLSLTPPATPRLEAIYFCMFAATYPPLLLIFILNFQIFEFKNRIYFRL